MGRLNAPKGYRADINNPSLAWITIDFERDVVVSEISTQGYGDNHLSEWVTEFKIYYVFGVNGDFTPLKDSFGNEKVGAIHVKNFEIHVCVHLCMVLYTII